MARELRDEDFETGSGLIDDFDGLITDAWFAPPRQEYVDRAGGDVTPFLNLKLEGPDLDQPLEQVWSTGSKKQWKVQRDGREIVSARFPETTQFVGNSRAGELVNRILGLLGEGDKAKGVQVAKSRGYLMTEAEFYIGLNFHWEQESKPTVGGEMRDVLMPTELLSADELSSSTATATTTLVSPAFNEGDIATLVELATGKTEQQLKQQVMRSDLKSNKELCNAIFNKGLLQQLEDEEKLTKGPDGHYI